MVLLPAPSHITVHRESPHLPDLPTKAIVSPGSIDRLYPRQTGTSGLEG